ncbi:Fc.00g078930.m01.CDS01 [Cosmosporella sp. VM-42]
MKLPCEVPEPTQRKKRGKSTRVAQLEKKIDGIVELLAASQAITGNAPPPLTPESPTTLHIQPQASTEAGDSCIDGGAPPDFPPDMCEMELVPGFRLTHEKANEYLAIYRQDYLPKNPFVPLPSTTTSYGLYSTSRFLFWAVMAVVVPLPGPVQYQVKKWFHRHIAEHMIVRQEKRLEFLQAILLHLGWNDFHVYIEMQATTLLQLAMALVIDLKLDKPPWSMGAVPRSLLGDAWQKLGKSIAVKPKSAHTLNEKRAVLGFHHISSLVAALFRRGGQLPWNAYLSHCCDSLLEAHEYETDIYLVALVRMQHVVDRVYTIIPLPSAEVHESALHDPAPSVYRAPYDMIINGARKELESFAKMQPDCIRQNKNFWAYYHIFIMRLYEPVIGMKAPLLSESDNLSAEPFLRTEALWKCLQSCNDFFNNLLTIPTSEYATLPFLSSSFLAFSIVTTSRILLLESTADWDTSIARKKLDFADFAKRMSAAFEEADRVTMEIGRRRRVMDDGSGVFLKYSYKLKWIRQWYMSRIPQEQPPIADIQNADMPAPELNTNSFSDFQYDENFWQELMSVEWTDPMMDIPLTTPT